ncbi:hypothetical protein Dsin_006678 [Dipteronia sinensis]|uniref:Phytochrome kinase substrate 1 n=1 Tax=Dipteronia sinensis TaxID=43782 RepID=A0AAE0AZ45_9ROSI|nr:hypothetical protein Dsin_006678 [Dipteronia sinensis]
MDSGKNSTGPGEVSFSYYVKSSEENFINKLGESFQYPNYSITSSPEFPSSRSLGRTRTAGGEIGVFGAEKYYNMKLEEKGPIIIDTASSIHGYSKRNQVDPLRVNSKSKPGTPSVTSEASWNSQTALLPSCQSNMSQSRQKKVLGKSIFASLSCNGSCSDKKSVYVNQQVEHGVAADRRKEYRKEAVQIAAHSPAAVMLEGRNQQQSRVLKVKDDHFPSNKDEFLGLPIAKSVKKQIAKEKIIEEEESRQSLDVFGSHTMNKEVIEVNLERKLSMLTWDAIPKGSNLSITSMRSHVHEDMESDASSDLFEIGNISGMSSCMTPTPYEPSETSIEWSVVTASAADFSAVSDYGETKLMTENITTPRLPTTSANKVAKTKSIVEKETQGSLPSKLLGCNSHKAVKVAESAYRTNEKAKSYHPQQPQRSVAAPITVRKLQGDIDKRF